MPRGIPANIEANKVRTETITFRLPSSFIENLRMEAELEGVTLNSYAAKIFANHIRWEKYERKVGLLPMTEAFLRETMNVLTDEQVINLAQKVEKQKFKDILAFMRDTQDIEDFVEIISTWLTVSWMQQNIEIKNGIYHFKIRHNMGRKWSLYVKTLLSELSQDILGTKAYIKTVGDTICFAFGE